MIKTRQGNYVIDCIGLVYIETKTELLRLIEPSAVYYENKIRQWHDQSYKYSLCRKPNWTST